MSKRVSDTPEPVQSNKKSKVDESDSNSVDTLKKENEKLKMQIRELRLNEASLVARLSAKEQEVHALQAELYDSNKNSNSSDLSSLMLDPCVNMLFTRMKNQLNETKEKLKQSQEDYSAATFTRESNNGRQLMSRIRLLQRENEALGQQLDTGKIHKLEVELEVCKETITFLNECKAEDTELLEHCLKEREQQIKNETL